MVFTLRARDAQNRHDHSRLVAGHVSVPHADREAEKLDQSYMGDVKIHQKICASFAALLRDEDVVRFIAEKLPVEKANALMGEASARLRTRDARSVGGAASAVSGISRNNSCEGEGDAACSVSFSDSPSRGPWFLRRSGYFAQAYV